MATSSCRLRRLAGLSLTHFRIGLARDRLPRALELDTACQGTIHDEVRSGDEAGGPARQKYHGIRHLLRCTHAAGRVEGQRGLVQFWIVVLDHVPDPALEIGVAR